jgi:hypothetical protein
VILDIVAALLEKSARTMEVTLDEVGEAIGARAITAEEIDAILTALEDAGRKVTSPGGGAGEAHLKATVAAARALAPELGRKPTAKTDVRHALMLLKIMQR